ncbi:hypothetical protein K438DRAFT_2027080 [Mycena galopus ATCC 62051]|nr:hypothetical protein K438DRAFT_2027080 [Mycena galopus ATCC 62051]
MLDSVRLWSLPGIPLNVGQMLVVAGYAVFALVCIILQVPLIESWCLPRFIPLVLPIISYEIADFLALAQLPLVFLLAFKNSPLPALLLGPGVDYKKLNYIHRWSARFIFLGAMQKEASGVAALTTLCLIVLTSVAPVRRWCYAAFLVLQ